MAKDQQYGMTEIVGHQHIEWNCWSNRWCGRNFIWQCFRNRFNTIFNMIPIKYFIGRFRWYTSTIDMMRLSVRYRTITISTMIDR